MKNLMITAALGTTFAISSTAAFADGHADITKVTCAEFTNMELADQQQMLSELLAAVEEADRDEQELADIALLCNGSEEEAVAMVLEQKLSDS